MKYVKADYFLNINSSKDKPSNNIKLFHNKISNNSLLRNNPENNNKEKIAILKKVIGHYQQHILIIIKTIIKQK